MREIAKGKTLQAVVEIAGSVSPSLGKAINSAKGMFGGMNGKAVAVGAAIGGIALATAKATVEATKYLADLGSQFDNAYDAIRIGTGATGEALDGLKEDFKGVYSSVPTTMEDASKAIADYNTRLGLTGDSLQGVSSQAIQVADMLGEDLGSVIESSSKAFQIWNIDAENMGSAMDYVFKASQSTGVGFTELMTQAQTFSPILNELGYSFEDSVALIGQMEKAGVNTSEVLASMKRSVGNLAKQGKSASEGMADYAKQIKEAGSMTEATNIAAEIFGSRGAASMAAAIRDGTVDVEGLTKALQESEETINGCAYDTYDFAEKLQVFKQNAQVALEPLATTVFDALNELMPVAQELMNLLIPVIEDMSAQLVPIIQSLIPAITPMLQQLLPVIGEIASMLLSELIPPFVELIISIIPVLVQLLQMCAPLIQTFISAILPVLLSLIQKLMPVFMSVIQQVLPILIDLINQLAPLFEQVITTVLPIILQLIEQLLPIAIQIITAVLPVILSLIQQLLPFIMQLIQAVLPVLVEILNLLTPILDILIQLLMPIIQLFMQLLEPILSLIMTAITPLIEIVMLLITQCLQPLMPIIQMLANLFTAVLGNALNAIRPIIDGVRNMFQGLINFITGVFSGNWKQAWSGVIQFFSGLWDSVVGIVKAPINAVIGLINKAIGGINSISVTIPEWVPAIGGKTFGCNLPTIAMLAKGGFTDGISIAGEAGTEAVISFDRSVRQDNIGYWLEAGRMLGVAPEQSTTSQAGKLLSLDNFSLGDLDGRGQTVIYYDFSNMTWSPTLGGATEGESDIMGKLRDHEAEFFDWLEEWVKVREEGKYCHA